MDATPVKIVELKPALAAVNDACQYLGGISRGKFYSDILPKLESVLVGGRRMVVVSSMDRLIDHLRQPAA